jgi:hypothetical protein
VRATHLETNLGMPPAADGSMAARARELLCRSQVPLPGEGAAAVEPPSAGDLPADHADAMADAAAAADAAADAAAPAVDDAGAAMGDDEMDEDDAGDDAAAALSDDSMDVEAPRPALVADARPDAQWAATLLAPVPPPPASPREADQAVEEAHAEAVDEAAAPPVAPPAAEIEPPVRPGRERKRKVRFGDSGELDGAARSWRTAAPPPKAAVDPSVDMGVPAYAMPGEEVFAMGLHAGTRKRFKATVLKLRKQFPRSAPQPPHLPTEHF